MSEGDGRSTERKNDGGAAFPHQYEDLEGHPNWRQSSGISLRDYFAAQALTAIIAKWRAQYRVEGESAALLNETTRAAARGAYHYADAMLKARGTAPTSSDIEDGAAQP